MLSMIQRIRGSEIWPWVLSLIGMILIAIESALAMSYPDPVIQVIGMALFMFGLFSLIWGLCMTEDDYGKLGVRNWAERAYPERFIDWAPYVMARWAQALTVGTLIVYAVLPVWPAAIAVSLLVLLLAVKYIPAVCRFFIPRYYMWRGEGRLHETHQCESSS